MEFQRINPAEVPAKCIELGIQPWRGSWYQPKTSYDKFCIACAVGIEAISKQGIEVLEARSGISRGAAIEMTGLDYDYAAGLSDGWEGFRAYCDDDNERYLAGVKDGKAAYAACEEAGLACSFRIPADA